MTYALDVYYYRHDDADSDEPTIVRTRAELDSLIDYIASHEQPNPPVLYARERPRRGRRQRPDHQLTFDLSAAADVGALAYLGEDPDEPGENATGAWVTHTELPVGDAPPLYLDKHVPYQFPTSSALPLERVRAALHEFMTTGQRPRCVQWQDWVRS
ncbi:Imm1 family immunity protein [Streptoalloteichus hindustanus]|uniref:Immunity protein Imm1 n=1 Tax=Streptoalloteichus hindustanus TaxID=2017 RepID=A0A1M4ZFT4_STRHI|nr:Imm1 family immunity protein [Streptoalloteichus hindustanus]SHF16914.1 Immunity protein Imm1 [Streptoalloteichus hindustanus]